MIWLIRLVDRVLHRRPHRCARCDDDPFFRETNESPKSSMTWDRYGRRVYRAR